MACISKQATTEAHSLTSSCSILCPTCGHVTWLKTPQGVSSLPRNLGLTNKQDDILHKFTYALCDSCGEDISIAYCVECTDHLLCKGCLSAHQKLRSSRAHSSFTFTEAQKMPRAKLLKLINPSYSTCFDHSGQSLEFYCQKCSVLICSECTGHEEHHFSEVSQVVSSKKEVVSQSAQDLQTAEEHLKKLMEAGEKIKEKIKSNKEQIDSIVHQSVLDFRKLLHRCEEILLSQNEECSIMTGMYLTQQLTEIEHVLNGVLHCHGLSESVMEQYDDIGLLSIVSTLTTRASELKFRASEMSIEDICPSNVTLNMKSNEIATMIANLSVVYNGAFPANTGIDIILSDVPVGRISKVRLTARDNRAIELSTGGVTFKGKLKPAQKKGKNISKEVGIIDCSNGTYLVSILPEILGEHILDITIHEQHIRGSPYRFQVSRDYSTMNKPIQTINGVNSPQFIAISDETGDIFVTSGSSHCVYVFDSSGKRKNVIGSYGKGPLQFQYPTGIAVTGNVLYVAEYEGNRIQKMTLDGEFLGAFGSEGSEEGQLWNPWGLCVGPNQKIYIAEFGNNRIQVFDNDSERFTYIIDGNISGDGCFQCPRDVSFDSLSGHIHISSYNSLNITVFTLDGVHMRHYGTFKEPFGLAYDEAGHTIVTDRKESRLFVFNRSYLLLYSVNNGIKNPFGVAIASDGGIWIADNGNNRLVQF